MILPPRPEHHAGIRALWSAAFGDTDAYLQHYFERFHKDENMLISVQQGESFPVAMLSLLPVTLCAGEARFPARYVYAVATDEGWQGMGLSHDLMEQALELMREQGEKAAILVPAHFSLFHFYERQGFEVAFYKEETAFSAHELPPCRGEATRLEAGALHALRRRAFGGHRLWPEWDERTLSYILSSNELCGGVALHLRCEEGAAFALCTPEGELGMIKELGLLGMSQGQALSLIHREMGCEKYILHLPCDGSDDPMPFGMIRWLDDEAKQAAQGLENPPYFALVMD